jgi:hypothetical protein
MQILDCGACGLCLSDSDTEDRHGICGCVVELGKEEEQKHGSPINNRILAVPCIPEVKVLLQMFFSSGYLSHRSTDDPQVHMYDMAMLTLRADIGNEPI